MNDPSVSAPWYFQIPLVANAFACHYGDDPSISPIIVQQQNPQLALPSLREILLIALGIGIGLWFRNTHWKLNSCWTMPLFGYFAGPILRILGLLVKIRVTTAPVVNHVDKDEVEIAVFGPDGEILPKNYTDTPREAGVELRYIPKHVAFIMDGNRRYGKRKYGKGMMGHWQGGAKAIQVVEWCSTEGVKYVTLYAFSTENWNRTPEEVAYLMDIFLRYVQNDLRPIVFKRKLRFKHIYSEKDRIPQKLLEAIENLRIETEKFPESNLTVNVCLSYGSRGEITNTFRKIASDCVNHQLEPEEITEEYISSRLSTSHCGDPDVLVRTSGEERISNFLLWQIAYTEFFFLKKDWPELEKSDILDVFRTFARGRQRRFGK